MEPIAVDVEHAAQLLSISPTEVYRRIRLQPSDPGHIAAGKVGKRIIVPVTALHDFVERLPLVSSTDLASPR